MKNIIFLNLNDILYMTHLFWTFAFNDFGKYGEIHFLIDYDKEMAAENTYGRYYYESKEIMLAEKYSDIFELIGVLCHELSHHYCNINHLDFDHGKDFVKIISKFNIKYSDKFQLLGPNISIFIYSLLECKKLLKNFDIENTEIKICKRKSNFNAYI